MRSYSADKITEIERQNRLLLEKIARIMTTPGKQDPLMQASQGSLHEQGAIKVNDPLMKRLHVMLNKRQKDLMKINDENMVGQLFPKRTIENL